jgi:cobalamin biosynthesis Mg chelatase CobN
LARVGRNTPIAEQRTAFSMNATEEDPKIAKKMAKAAAKAAKKRAKTDPIPGPSAEAGTARQGGRTPAERAAQAAERQVALQRWRVAFAVITAIIALGSLLVMIWMRT